jgi:hypothetical protein
MGKKPLIIETTYRVVDDHPVEAPERDGGLRRDAPILIFIIGLTLLFLFVQNFDWVERQLDNNQLRIFIGAFLTYWLQSLWRRKTVTRP